nr:hypothetical protein [Tanacetum cinerariifolium]
MRLLKLVDEPSAEDVLVEEPAYNEEEANLQRDLELSIKEQAKRTQGLARPVVIRELDSGRIQPLPNVQGKGKEKVVDEQATHDLLTLQTPKKKSHELALTDSETKSDDVVTKIYTGDQDEGQAGTNTDQLLSDKEEALQKKRKRRDVPRTPSVSPPPQPPPLPPPAGASGAPAGLSGTQELSPTDSMILDDSILDEQVHLSDDQDSGNNHLPTADSRKGWWKPLPAEERPATPKPTWSIPSSTTEDMKNFLNWYYRQVNKTVLTQADLKGQAYEVVKAFYPDVIQLYKGSSLALSISKIKAASYLEFDLELLVSEQIWIDDVCTYDISAKYSMSHWWFNRQKFYIDRHASPSTMRILNVVRIKAYSRYGYDYLSEIILRRADFQEHTIAEKDFKNLHPSDFEDLNLLLLQDHLDHLPGSDKRMLSTAVKLWTRNLVIRQRVEDF